MPGAVIFDLDGVLADSEHLWNEAKEGLARETGATWKAQAPQAMLGMSSTEWAVYLHEEIGIPLAPAEIDRRVLARMVELYHEREPVIDGAPEAVREIAARWPVGLASSSNREIIDLFLEVSGLKGCFTATVSSEEVARGKPSPDVYLEAARRLDVRPDQCVAVEDSSNGMRSAVAAGMSVIAIPNRDYPPSDDALALASSRIDEITQLTPELVERAAGAGHPAKSD